MTGFERAAMLLACMRDLTAVMQTETAVLRTMRVERLEALEAEKASLGLAYERMLGELRRDPGLVAGLDDAARAELAAAMRELQREVQDNLRRLRAARTVVEGVLRTLGRSLGHEPVTYGGRAAAGLTRAEIVPLALNRQA